MKNRHWTMGWVLFVFFVLAGSTYAQDKAREATVSMLGDFFADPAAITELASQPAGGSPAVRSLMTFPPHIQKRLEKVVLMIVQESGADAVKYTDTLKTSGSEGAFHSFSPAVQREIQEIAEELEKDPEFMKRAGILR
ncbi:MAG: hypothetical protein LLG97_03880 [Deltaproteobacteria bacterium]|nr:hypothetical protein [Deltaproteobacteria bacterium]